MVRPILSIPGFRCKVDEIIPALPTEADRLAHNADIPVKLAQLVVMHANRLGFSLRSVRRPSRHRPLVACRVEIATICREEGFSYPQIGRAFNRDHTTMMTLLQRHPEGYRPKRVAA